MDEDTHHDEAASDRAAKPERRPTVIVTCAVPNGVQIRRHTPGLEDHAPMMPTGQGYELKQGDTGGIDKEWFDGWRKENQSLSLITSGQITWRDEPEPEEAEDVEQQDERVQQLADEDGKPASVGMGIQDGPGNPARSAPAPQPETTTMQPDEGKQENQPGA